MHYRALARAQMAATQVEGNYITERIIMLCADVSGCILVMWPSDLLDHAIDIRARAEIRAGQQGADFAPWRKKRPWVGFGNGVTRRCVRVYKTGKGRQEE